MTSLFSNINIYKLLTTNVSIQALPIFVGIISIPIIIEIYGRVLFSVYAIGVASIVLLNYLHLGIATNINRELSLNAENSIEHKKEIFFRGLISILFLSIIIVVLVSLSLPAYFNLLTFNSLLESNYSYKFLNELIFQIPLIFLIILLRQVMEANLNFFISALNRAVVNSLILFSPIALFYLGLDFSFLARVILIIHLLSLIFLLFHCMKYLVGRLPQLQYKKFLSLFKSGISLTLISFAMMVFLYADRFLLSALEDLNSIAFYIAPFDVLTRISFVYGSMGAVFFPIYSRLISVNKGSDFIRIYRNSYLLVFCVVGLIALTFILFSSELLDLWLGRDFKTESSQLAKIIACGILITSLTVVPFRTLISLKKEKELSIFYVSLGVIYIFLSYYLILIYGL